MTVLLLWPLAELVRGAAPAEPGWDSVRIAGVELASQPVAMPWDASGRLWVLESTSSAVGGKSRVLRVDFPEETWSQGRVEVYAEDLPEASGFEVSRSGVWLAAASRLLWVSDVDNQSGARKAQPLIGWGTPTAHGAVVHGLRRHRDGWLYGALQSSDVVTPQLLAKGLTAPPRLTPGVIRFHPSFGVLEQYSEGPFQAIDLEFDSVGHLFVLTSTRETLYSVIEGACYVQKHQFPRPVRTFLDVGEPLQGADLRTYGYAGMVAGASGISDILWLRHSNVSAWLPLHSLPSGAAVQLRPMSGSKPVIGRIDTASQSAVQGPADSLFFRVNGGLVRVTPPGWLRAVERVRGLRDAASMARVLEVWKTADLWTERLIDRRLLDAEEAAVLGLLEGSWGSLTPSRRRAAAVQLLAARSRSSNVWMTRAAVDLEAEVRLQVAKVIGEKRLVSPEALQLLVRLASDQDPRVRREVAVSTRTLSMGQGGGAKSRQALELAAAFQILVPLIETTERQPDRLVESLIWAALEPYAALVPVDVLTRLTGVGGPSLSVAGPLVRKTVWRAFSSQDDRVVDRVLDQLLALADTAPSLCAFGLEGMMQGQKVSKAWTGSKSVKRLLRKLTETASPELVSAAQRVEALCGNPKSQEAILRRIVQPDLSEAERIRAIEFTKLIPSDEARGALLECLRNESPEAVKRAAVEAFQEVGTLADAGVLLTFIGEAGRDLRAAILEAFERRETWWPLLLGGLESGRVPRQAVSPRFEAMLKSHPNLKFRARALAALSAESAP